MAAIFLGALTLAAIFPGFAAVLVPVDAALVALRAEVQVAASTLASVQAQLDAALALVSQIEADLTAAFGVHLDGLESARVAIRAAALADALVQLSAALDIEAGLTVGLTDPVTYLAGLISAAAQVQLDIGALVPQVALSAQLDAVLGLRLEAEAKVAAFDAVLAIFGELSAALQAALDAVLAVGASLRALIEAAKVALAAVVVALNAQLAASLAPLSAALQLEADLGLGTAEVYRYDGQLDDLAPGADLGNEITAQSGLAPSTVVRTWVIVVDDSLTTVKNKLGDLLKTTP